MGSVVQEEDNIPREEEDQPRRSLTNLSRAIEFTILVSLPVIGILFILDLPGRLGLTFFH